MDGCYMSSSTTFKCPYFTPGNVVRGNQNYANEILTGASGHELQSVDRMSTNLHASYKFLREKSGNLAMWFPVVYISIQDW